MCRCGDREAISMAYLAISGLPLIEEDEAADEVAELYAEAKRALQVPFVRNFMKAGANSPAALAHQWHNYHTLLHPTPPPQALTSMIYFTNPKSNQCEYCAANNELTCRTLGIDEETL